MQDVVSTIVQVSVFLPSCVVSVIMATAIFRSSPGLKIPLRRLIFCLCVCSAVETGTFVLAPFLTPGNRFSIGNQATCDLQVIMFQIAGNFGFTGYTFGLCLYFLFVVRYGFTDERFKIDIERYVHITMIISAIVNISIIVSSDIASPLSAQNNLCFVVDNPFGCHAEDSNIECIRGENAHYYGYGMIIVPVGCSFIGTIAALGLLWWTVYSKERELRKRLNAMFAHSLVRGSRGSRGMSMKFLDGRKNEWKSVGDVFRFIRSRLQERGESKRSVEKYFAEQRKRSLTMGERAARKKSQDTMSQALLYVSVYVFTYIWPTISVLGFHFRGKKLPFWLSLISSIHSLGGVLTILVYIRPRVATVRKRKEDYSWLKAMWEVVKAGGDVPKHCKKKPLVTKRTFSTSTSTGLNFRQSCAHSTYIVSSKQYQQSFISNLNEREKDDDGDDDMDIESISSNTNDQNSSKHANEDFIKSEEGTLDQKSRPQLPLRTSKEKGLTVKFNIGPAHSTDLFSSEQLQKTSTIKPSEIQNEGNDDGDCHDDTDL